MEEGKDRRRLVPPGNEKSPHAAPARPLRSATGSAAVLKLGRQPCIRPAVYFRFARIRKPGPALSLVIQRGG